jgi:hypothetical protein
VLYDLEVRIVIPWHVLSRSAFAVFGLGLVKHPAEILVCRVVGTVMLFNADPHLVESGLPQRSRETSGLEVGSP